MSNNWTEATKVSWDTAIEEVARFVSQRYPDVEKEDLQQDLWVYVLEQTRFNSPDDDGCRTSMYWLARKKTAGYRAQHLSLSAQYCYTTDDLRSILEEWPSVLTSDTEDKSLAEAAVVHSDVQWAYSELTASYRNAIYGRYILGEIPGSGTKERKTLNRAIGKLADVLNTYTRTGVASGPTVRRVLSGSQSRHSINSQYDPDVG